MASRTPRGGRRPVQPRWLPFMRNVWLPVVTLLAGYSLLHMHRLLDSSRARNGSSDSWPWALYGMARRAGSNDGTSGRGKGLGEESLETGPGRPRSLESKPRIALITNAVTYPFSEASLRSWTRYNEFFANKDCYAKRHGYDLIVDYRNHVEGMGFYVDPEKSGGRGPTNVHFNKPYLLRKWLPHYDWVLWLDMDALILDMDRKVEDIAVELSDNVHLLLPQEQMTVFFFSAYALLLRGSAEAQALVEDWFALKDSCPHGLYDDQSRLYAAVLRAQLAARGVKVNQTLVGTTDCLDRCEHANTTRDFSWCFDRAIKANGHKRLPAPQHGPVAFSALPTDKFKHGNDTGLALQGMFGGIRDRPDLVEHAFAIHVKPHCVRQGEKFCSPFLDAVREERYHSGMRSCYGDGWAADVLPALADPRKYAEIFGATAGNSVSGGGGQLAAVSGQQLPPPQDVGIAADWEALSVGILAQKSGWPGHSGKPAVLSTALLLSANLSAELYPSLAGLNAPLSEFNASAGALSTPSAELEAAARKFQDGSRRRAEAAARARAPVPALNPNLGVKFSQLRARPEKMRVFARGSDSAACFAAVPGSGGASFAAEVLVPLLREYLCDVGGECVIDPQKPRPEELEVATSVAAQSKNTDAQKIAAGVANAEHEGAAQLQLQLEAAEAAAAIAGVDRAAAYQSENSKIWKNSENSGAKNSAAAAFATDIFGVAHGASSMASAEPADRRRREKADAAAGGAIRGNDAEGFISAAAAAELPKSGTGRQGGGDAVSLLSWEPLGGGRARRRGNDRQPTKPQREGGFGGWARDGKHRKERRRLEAGAADQFLETADAFETAEAFGTSETLETAETFETAEAYKSAETLETAEGLAIPAAETAETAGGETAETLETVKFPDALEALEAAWAPEAAGRRRLAAAGAAGAEHFTESAGGETPETAGDETAEAAGGKTAETAGGETAVTLAIPAGETAETPTSLVAEMSLQAERQKLSFPDTRRFLEAANGETADGESVKGAVTGVTTGVVRDSAWPLRPAVVEGREALPCSVRMATALFPYNLLSAYRSDYPLRPWHFTFLRDPVDRVLISYIKAREAAAAAAHAGLTGGESRQKAVTQWCGDSTYARKGEPPPVWQNTTWREFVDFVGHDEIVTKFYSGVAWSTRRASDHCLGYALPAKYPPGNFKTYSHFQANGAVGKLLEYEYFGIFAQWERSIRLLRATLSGGGAWQPEKPPPSGPPGGRTPLEFPTPADNLLSELGSAEAVAEFVGRRLDPEVREYILRRNPKDAMVYERAVNEFERRCRHFGV